MKECSKPHHNPCCFSDCWNYAFTCSLPANGTQQVDPILGSFLDRKSTYAAVVSLTHKPSRTLWEKESMCASWTDLIWLLSPDAILSCPTQNNKNVHVQLVMNKSVWLQTVNLGVWQIPKAGKIISMFWSIKPFPHSLKHIHQPPGLNQYHQHSRLHQNSAFSCWEPKDL